MTAAAKNLKAISEAIDQHNGSCDYPLVEVRLCPFEVERLGWDKIRGVPIVADERLGTGRFRLVCSRGDHEGESVEAVEAVAARYA